MPARQTVLPMDRSICPEIISRVTAQAEMITKEFWISTYIRLKPLMKRGFEDREHHRDEQEDAHQDQLLQVYAVSLHVSPLSRP